MEEATIKNFRHNSIAFEFSNGNGIDAIFGWGTYSDNSDLGDFHEFANKSTTVEVMFHCGDKLAKRIEKKHGEQPLSRLGLDDWFDIVNLIRKEKKE